MYQIFNKPKLTTLRKNLRKSSTPQESKLWFYLRGNNLGVKFRRQHGVGSYIADFYCKEKNLVIEIDGSQHIEAEKYDAQRDTYTESLGLGIIRFWNNEIDTNMEGVLMRIKEYIDSPLRSSTTSPSQGRKNQL